MPVMQGIMLFATLVAVGCMGVDVKGEAHPKQHLPWWVYLAMIAVFLADYKIFGRM